MEGSGIGKPLFGALLAAVIGAGLWALIAILTDYESGIVAWGIGILTGYAVVLSTNKRATRIHQVFAVVASLLGIFLGKYFIFSYFYYSGFTGLLDKDTYTYFIEYTVDVFRVTDLIFIALAVITAWRMTDKLQKPAEPTSSPETVTPE